jgi:hypothetical protein
MSATTFGAAAAAPALKIRAAARPVRIMDRLLSGGPGLVRGRPVAYRFGVTIKNVIM